MTIQQALKRLPHEDSELLLAYVLRKPREFLLLNPETQLTKSQLVTFRTLHQRRKKGEPFAYLVREQWFYGRKFFVDKRVLIPRPESEWLIDRSKEILKGKKARILDVGTGSGCVAVTAELELPGATVEACDVSGEALTVAKKNAKELGATVTYYRSNLLQKTTGKYDLVIANLPYVPASDYLTLKSGLRFEPKDAITDGTDDFFLIERLISELPARLAPGGSALLEIDPKAKKSITTWVQQHMPTVSLVFTKDLHGLTRFAEISLSGI